jgi:hypothetical protein
MMNLLYTNNKSLLFNFADRQGWQNRLYAAIVAKLNGWQNRLYAAIVADRVRLGILHLNCKRLHPFRIWCGTSSSAISTTDLLYLVRRASTLCRRHRRSSLS